MNNGIATVEDVRALLAVVDTQCTDPAILKATLEAQAENEAQIARLAAAKAVSDAAATAAQARIALDRATASLAASNAILAEKQKVADAFKEQLNAPEAAS